MNTDDKDSSGEDIDKSRWQDELSEEVEPLEDGEFMEEGVFVSKIEGSPSEIPDVIFYPMQVGEYAKVNNNEPSLNKYFWDSRVYKWEDWSKFEGRILRITGIQDRSLTLSVQFLDGSTFSHFPGGFIEPLNKEKSVTDINEVMEHYYKKNPK